MQTKSNMKQCFINRCTFGNKVSRQRVPSISR